MKHKVGKQSFCSSNSFLLIAVLTVLFFISQNSFSLTNSKNYSNSSNPDSLLYHLYQLVGDINSEYNRINFTEELIKYKFYNAAWEQLQYFEPIDSNRADLLDLKEKVILNYSPPIFHNRLTEQPNQNIINVIDSLDVLVETNAGLLKINNLSKNDPDNPDVLYIALKTKNTITNKQQKLREEAIAQKNVEENIRSQKTEPMEIPRSNEYSKNVNPFDFHKGLRIVPTTYIYHDDTEYQYLIGGVNADVGLNNILGFGFSIQRGHVRIPTKLMRIKRVQVSLFLKPVSNLLLSTNIGEDKIGSESSTTADVSMKYEVFRDFYFKIAYLRDDASMVFKSNNLVGSRVPVNSAKISALYNFNEEVQLTGYYQFFRSNSTVMIFNGVRRSFPTNLGNNLSFGIKKGFGRYFSAGLEYFFSDFESTIPIYYSPQNYKHQSIYCEAAIVKSKNVEMTIGGKLGYIFDAESALKEIYSSFSFIIYHGLRINVDGYYNLGKRYNDNYDSGSINIGAYWSLIK